MWKIIMAMMAVVLAGYPAYAVDDEIPVKRAQEPVPQKDRMYRGETDLDRKFNSPGARNLAYKNAGNAQMQGSGADASSGMNGASPQGPAYIDDQGREIYYDRNGNPFYYVIEGGKSDAERLEEAARDYRAREALKRRLDNEAIYERDFDMEFPFTPQQIRNAKRRQIEIGEALELPVPNQGITRSQVVSLKPGAKNGVIHCYPQYATTIRVLDSQGNPWPIMAHMIGNSANFQVQKPDMEPYDTIIVSPLTSLGSTNLVLMLDNNDGEDPVPPLALQLVVSPNFREQYDTVASIRVDRKGPRAPAPIVVGDAGNFYATPEMLKFLDGVPPEGAVRLKTSDKSVDAWEYNNLLYVRTPRKIVWPAWNREVADGQRSGQIFAYELPMVPAVSFSGNRSVRIGRYSEAVTRLMQGE